MLNTCIVQSGGEARRSAAKTLAVRLSRRAGVLAITVALLVATASCTINLTLPSGPSATASRPTSTSTDSPGTASPTSASAQALQRTVARITQLDENGGVCTWGSGAIVDRTGLILTNYHVVAVKPACPYEQLGVALSDDPERAPELRYFASVVAFDEALDLAVLRITESVDSDQTPTDLPTIAVGDSDGVAIGDPITVLGYPSLGGDTVTVTSGSVSGFRSDGEQVRGWFKTDATVTGGNSGGEAVNARGELVAVPTEASQGMFGETADCRPSRDTNDDGKVDGDDQCVPIGGFLTLLRPVALGKDLLAEAAEAEPIPTDDLWPRDYDPEPGGEGDELSVSNPRFGTGVLDGELLGEGASLGTAADQVCVLLDFENVPDQLGWRYAWYHDGTEVESETHDGLVWNDGPQLTTPLCAGIANGSAVKPGLWEIKLAMSTPETYEAAFNVLVGDDHAIVDVAVRVERAGLCALDTRPMYGSEWHTSAESESWRVGQSFTFELPAGRYDLRATGCDGEVLGYGLDLEIKDGSSLRLR